MAEQTAPTNAVAISVIGGILYLIVGVFDIQSIIHYLSIIGTRYLSQTLIWHGIEGIIFGITIIVSAYIAYSRPSYHTKAGIAIIVVVLVSLLLNNLQDIFIITGLIGIIGGVFMIVWKPPTIVGEVKKPE